MVMGMVCVCPCVSCLSVCLELIGTFYGHGYGLCLSVRFVFVHKFVGAVFVLHYFPCLSIFCIFEEMRQAAVFFLFIFHCRYFHLCS